MKTLILDIETAPKIAYVWGLWKQNVSLNQLHKDMYVLNWSAKWLDDEYYYSDSLHYHSKYKKDPENDIEILKSIWKMLDAADIVVAHNGDRFDIPTLQSRFLLQGMHPPSAFRTVDTLKIARRRFKLTSNKLEFIAKSLQLGSKISTGGFDLWRNIIENKDIKEFDRMVEYCENDVFLLEEVYKALRPWDNTHPSTVILEDISSPACNVCGSRAVIKNGSYATNIRIYQKYKCKDCGHSMRSRYCDKVDKDYDKNILRSL